MTLCRTSQTELFTQFFQQNGTFGLVRKLWTSTTNGFYGKSWLWYNICIKTTHLNAGIGFPCAGHNSEKDFSILILNEPKVSEVVENFGSDIPMGSKKLEHLFGFLNHAVVVPEWWKREPLSRASYSKTLTHWLFECGRINNGWKFRFG